MDWKVPAPGVDGCGSQPMTAGVGVTGFLPGEGFCAYLCFS